MSNKQIPKTLPVIPLFDTVIVPQMRSKMRVNGQLAKKLAHMVSQDTPFGIALTVREKTEGVLSPASLYTVGCLVHIESIQESDSGALVNFTSLKRIRSLYLTKSTNSWSATAAIRPVHF